MTFVTEFVSRLGGRDNNEDYGAFAEAKGAGCWVVADGLGGYRGGEIASRQAVEAVLASFQGDPEPSAASLQRHLEAAQKAVLTAQAQPNLTSMRTTIVALIADSSRAIWAHMGDSRLYCIENGAIAAHTRDHSVVQMMVDSGDITADQVRHHQDRNRLLRSLGNEDVDFRPTILSEPRKLNGETAFLLCTDGFWDNVTDTEIEVDLAKAANAAEWLSLMENRLLERSAEGDDNYTAMAVVFDSETAPSSPRRRLSIGLRKQAATSRETEKPKTPAASALRITAPNFLLLRTGTDSFPNELRRASRQFESSAISVQASAL
jgi:PPM family protein phosphatase